jgi:hypothetical protein
LDIKQTEVPEFAFGEQSGALRLFMKARYLQVMGSQLNTPTPRDAPFHHSNRARAYRILLVGNGASHGWGVVSHKMALTGQLASAITSMTGFPTDVDCVGEEMMNAAGTLTWLKRHDLSPYDLIIVNLSLNDALRLTPIKGVQKSLTAVAEYLQPYRKAGTSLMAVSSQQPSTFYGYRNDLGKLADRHAIRVTAALNEVAENYGITHMQLDTPFYMTLEGDEAAGSKDMYNQWAWQIAKRAMPLLPGMPSVLEKGVADVATNPVIEKMLGFDGEKRTATLDAIVDRAKKKLHMPIAYVSLVDNGIQYFPTATGPMAAAVPLELTVCNYAVQQEETLEVKNIHTDERFKDNPYTDIVSMGYYSGRSLRDEEGNVMGTFCVMHPAPKAGAVMRSARFEQLADEAEAELRKIKANAEREVANPVEVEAVPVKATVHIQH